MTIILYSTIGVTIGGCLIAVISLIKYLISPNKGNLL